MKYEMLEHTADAKFRAYGSNLEEAFTNAALATGAIMADMESIEASMEKKVNVSANRKESLLYDFLEEILFLLDTENFLIKDVKSLAIEKREGKFQLSAVLVGGEADKYEIFGAIKAVTYSDMFIKEEDGQVIVQVVHDL